MTAKRQSAPRPWRHLIPAGWVFAMSYDNRGDGSALFGVPMPGGERRTYRIRSGAGVGWNPEVEAFGEAALRRLFELYPDLKPGHPTGPDRAAIEHDPEAAEP